ncbi:hypothetical protein [Streptomyces sp. NPDC094049]|uniref:hypothetical protein n=1 Tax=Streptomyces sp. NPDC094049 TaxID=3154987 RepID=UPI00332F79AA
MVGIRSCSITRRSLRVCSTGARALAVITGQGRTGAGLFDVDGLHSHPREQHPASLQEALAGAAVS